MKNGKLSQLDTDQIVKATYQEDIDAQRVVLVGEKLNLSIDSNKIADAVKEGLSNIKINSLQESISRVDQSAKIQTVEKNVFIPQVEIKSIEIPTIVKEIEYRTIEIPVITERLVTIEKPIIVKETDIKEISFSNEAPAWLKFWMIMQSAAIVGYVICHILK